jgi:hypothetical protein
VPGGGVQHLVHQGAREAAHGSLPEMRSRPEGLDMSGGIPPAGGAPAHLRQLPASSLVSAGRQVRVKCGCFSSQFRPPPQTQRLKERQFMLFQDALDPTASTSLRIKYVIFAYSIVWYNGENSRYNLSL